MDADSTLLQGEVMDLLAERCGCGAEVAAVTAAAMAGELDFAEALRQRVRLLAGLEEADLEAVRDGILLTPGARTLVRTLKRLGYELAVVSGGFMQVIEPLVRELGIDHLAANVLVLEGRAWSPASWTGRSWTGPARPTRWCVSPRRRACPWRGRSPSATAPTTSTCWPSAGLGIAFNAKPVVRQAADTALERAVSRRDPLPPRDLAQRGGAG